jgi:transcriptional regulator with XRE-family HTH domain
MTQPYDAEGLPSPSSALLQLARLKAGISQRELADRAGVPVTMISAYERDQRQPTLTTLLKLLRAAGFDLRLHLAAYDPHDDILAGLEAGRSESERRRRDEQLQAWRQATDLADVIRSKESAGRPKDLRVLPLLYRHQSMRRDGDG